MDKQKDPENFNLKDERFFHQFFRQFYSYLVVFAERRVGNHETAEDIVQDVFVAVWENEKHYNSLSGLKAYLYEAVNNRIQNYYKHQEVEKKYINHLMYEQKLPDFSVRQEEIYRNLYLAINKLPERNREVMLLYLEGKSNQEIAQQLNLTVLTVKTHKRNAFRYLKGHLNLLLYIMIVKQQTSIL